LSDVPQRTENFTGLGELEERGCIHFGVYFEGDTVAVVIRGDSTLELKQDVKVMCLDLKKIYNQAGGNLKMKLFYANFNHCIP
jgi:hypothetical protein